MVEPQRERIDWNKYWFVGDIEDQHGFMRFVIERAPLGSIWVFDELWQPETIRVIEPWATPPLGKPLRHLFGCYDNVEVPLTAEAKKALIPQLIPQLGKLLPKIHEIWTQRILNGNRPFFVSYDTLNICWITKEITKLKMTEAARRYGFYFD